MKMRKDASIIRWQGHFNKFENYFRSLNKDKVFQNRVAAIRKRHKIEPKFDPKLSVLSDSKATKLSFIEDIDKLSQQYFFPSFAETSLTYYVLTDAWLLTPFQSEIDVVDIKKTYIENPSDGWRSFRKSIAELRPIAIEFSPYTSARDLISFINKSYKSQIEPRQQKYINKKIKIGKGRHHALEERNEFIFQKHLEGNSAKKIMSLLREAGMKVVGYTYINSIIRERRPKAQKQRK